MERHKGALVLAHPECEEPVLRHAHFIGSTTAILKYALLSENKSFIVATESGILWRDPALGIKWPDFAEPILSGKDAIAQTLAQWLARPESDCFKF